MKTAIEPKVFIAKLRNLYLEYASAKFFAGEDDIRTKEALSRFEGAREMVEYMFDRRISDKVLMSLED